MPEHQVQRVVVRANLNARAFRNEEYEMHQAFNLWNNQANDEISPFLNSLQSGSMSDLQREQQVLQT